MAHQLHKPIVKTYYIILDNDIIYGCVESNQVMTSGRAGLIENFTIEQEWLNRLAELGINPNQGV